MIGFVNLDNRTDRLEHMKVQLDRIGVKAERVRGRIVDEFDLRSNKYRGMVKRGTLGAIGCHYSQVGIMEQSLAMNEDAWVMEDDLIFCEDFDKRYDYIQEWMSRNEWDVFWLGGTYHNPPHWHKPGHNIELQQCKCTLGRDMELTDDLRIVRTYGCFCTYCYIVNKDSLEKVLKLLDENVHLSMGIDWLFILLQPRLKTFAFVPGCVKQMDNQSDIGDGVTMFSGFSKLNGTVENSWYWYQDRMGCFEHNSWWHNRGDKL